MVLILVASYTNDISTLEFDPLNLTLSLVSSITVGHHPSWITAHPDDKSLVFTGLEKSDGEVVAIKYDTNGKGEVVAQIPSGGDDPCTLVATHEELIIGNYSSGTISAFPVSTQPPYLPTSVPTTAVQLQGSGPNQARQESSHAHQVVLNGGELLVPDLGADKTWRFTKDASGKWEISGSIEYPSGGGPRHIVIHDGVLYAVLELTSNVVSHKLSPDLAQAKIIKEASTFLNPPNPLGDMLAAEILLPKPNKSFPQAYLYVSNRNDPSSEGDSIAIFSVQDPNNLELVAEVRTGLKHVRGILFGGKDDKWLLAGGVHGGGVKIFERVDGGKGLKELAEYKSIEAPTGFLWL